jgi:bacteriocin leader peptide (microcyclamide/patellamide family)
MNNKSITPSVQQPVDRIASGQLPSALAELSEAALSGTLTSDVLPLGAQNFCNMFFVGPFLCSYDDGGDE